MARTLKLFRVLAITSRLDLNFSGRVVLDAEHFQHPFINNSTEFKAVIGLLFLYGLFGDLAKDPVRPGIKVAELL